MQADLLSRATRAYFVPFVSREGCANNNMLIVANTPDTDTESEITEDDLHESFERARIPGFINVTRRNYNIFFATFTSSALSQQARDLATVNLRSTDRGSALKLRGEHWLLRPPRVFTCDNRHAATDLSMVSACIVDALKVASDSQAGSFFKLLIQVNESPTVKYPIYTFLIRFSRDSANPYMERFYFPLPSRYGEKEVWAVFKPYIVCQPCGLCGNV